MGLVLFEDPRDGSEMRSGVDGQYRTLGPFSGCRANQEASHIVLNGTTTCALNINPVSFAKPELNMHVIFQY